MATEWRALAAAAALALSACASLGPRPFEPHVAWPASDDAGWATVPPIGVAELRDQRVAELRAGWRPPLRLRLIGLEREGVEHTGDSDFERPVADGVRADVIATLQRAGTFASVTPVDFDPRDPAAWPEGAPPLVLVGSIETFEGRQWRSLRVSPIQLGFVRERWGPAQGRVTLHVELWSKAERLLEARVSTHHDSPEGSAADAALQALALDAEKLALRLDARLRGQRAQPPRKLDVRVLDGCDVGEARVRRLIGEVSAIFEREAGIVLAALPEPWSPAPRDASLDSLLEDAQRVAPPPGGVVLALAPAQQVSELALRSQRAGLAVPLGTHAVVLCTGEEEDEASVLTSAHELAHLFGAVHVREPASIMNATADFDARLFDPLNRRVVRALRTRDFAQPLDPQSAAELEEIYRSAGDELIEREVGGALRLLGSD